MSVTTHLIQFESYSSLRVQLEASWFANIKKSRQTINLHTLMQRWSACYIHIEDKNQIKTKIKNAESIQWKG